MISGGTEVNSLNMRFGEDHLIMRAKLLLPLPFPMLVPMMSLVPSV